MIIIAGPCIIENYEILEQTVKILLDAIKDKEIDFYFKSSYAKDNRTKIENFHGYGPEMGINFLVTLKKEYGVKICTDFHSAQEIKDYGHKVDMIQIPAYLGQQTSILKAAALQNKKIHLKKPQFLSPNNIQQPVQKLLNMRVDPKDIIVSDRGTLFGYEQLIMDPRHIPIMKEFSSNVLFDITHPNKKYISRSNNNSFILGKTAMVSGADGLFFETHPDPMKALCDADTQLPLAMAERLINECYDLWKANVKY